MSCFWHIEEWNLHCMHGIYWWVYNLLLHAVVPSNILTYNRPSSINRKTQGIAIWPHQSNIGYHALVVNWCRKGLLILILNVSRISSSFHIQLAICIIFWRYQAVCVYLFTDNNRKSRIKYEIWSYLPINKNWLNFL